MSLGQSGRVIGWAAKAAEALLVPRRSGIGANGRRFVIRDSDELNAIRNKNFADAVAKASKQNLQYQNTMPRSSSK